MGKSGSKAIERAQKAPKATKAAAEVMKLSGSKPKKTAKELDFEKLAKKREQAPKTRRSNYSDNDGAASDGEPDRRGKEVPGRAKAKVPARKGRQSGAAKGASCAYEDVAMDECYGISMENVKHGKKGVKKATAHGKACTAQESAGDEADDADDDASDLDAAEDDSNAQDKEGSHDSDPNSLDDSSSSDSDDDDDSDEEEPPTRVRAGRKVKGKAPSKQPELKMNRKKIKKGHQGKNELLAAIKSLFEEKPEKKGRKKSTNEEQSTPTPDQRKDIVRYCKEHLAKKSMYPSNAELEKAAKKLAKDEDEKSASFRRAVKKVVGTAMTKQIRGETSKAIKAARTKYYGQDKEGWEAALQDLSYRILGDQQYGAQAFISLLQDVFSPAKQASGAMELSAAEVAYAELGVVLYLNGIEEFPKDDAKGQKWREAYRRFLDEAGAGINEKALVVKALK